MKLINISGTYVTLKPLLQKLLVERYIQENLHNSTILRLTKVLSDESPFIRNLREAIKNEQPIRAFTNRYISPVDIESVCSGINQIIELQSFVLFQLGGQIELSYLDFAKEYFFEQPYVIARMEAVEDLNDFGAGFNSLATHLPKNHVSEY